jgi:predicted DNA-binding transcriptional regulator YafY
MDSLSRHEQLLRVFHILDILFSARRPLGIADFKNRLQARGVIDEMSDKNLRRDIEFLRRFGYSLKGSTIKGARGAPKQVWTIEPGKGAAELVAPSISLPELLSLGAARDFLAPLAGTMYWRGISQVLAKMEAVATPSLIEYAASLRDGLVVHPSPPKGKYKSSMLNAINRAISNSVTIELDYTTRSRDEPRRYLIQPEALVVYEGSLYIAGYRADIADQTDPRSRALHFFKMDRVSRAKPTSRCFSRKRESVSSLLSDSITLYRSIAEPRRYRIRISPAPAKSLISSEPGTTNWCRSFWLWGTPQKCSSPKTLEGGWPRKPGQFSSSMSLRRKRSRFDASGWRSERHGAGLFGPAEPRPGAGAYHRLSRSIGGWACEYL